MTISSNAWAIVLAGGEGSRLHSLTTDNSGNTVPKQFCSLRGGQSLLNEALQRAASIVEPDHICVIVAAQHRRWWEPCRGSRTGTRSRWRCPQQPGRRKRR
jgi:mannose-1-phosphate guanylyltransferase